MRALFGLAVPLLLLAVTFTTMVPQASAEVTYYTISGHVASDAGVPLEGVRVNAYSYPEERTFADDGAIRNADAVTDEKGAFSFKLPAGKGYINVYYEKWRQSDGREITLDRDVTLDFTIRTPPPKDARIEGRVVDVNGNPVANAEVSLQSRCCYAMPTEPAPAPTPATATEPASPADGNASTGSSSGMAVDPARSFVQPYYWDDYATTVSDADGRFSFDAYEGPRQIYAWAKGYAQTTVAVDTVSGKTVTAEVVLEKVPAADAVIAGRVIDAKTGLPLARAQVNLRSLEWGRYAWAETGEDGSFRMTTIPGWAEISVNYYAYAEPAVMIDSDVASKPIAMPIQSKQQYYPYMALIDLKSGTNDVDAPLDPKPAPTIALVGYVVDPDTKKAVPDARVSVWNHETGDWGEAVTDATGSYKILVREGHYSGSAWKDGYLGGTQSFRVTGDATQRVDLLMPKGTQKWAPCYDESDGCGGGPIMYSRAEATMASAPSSGGYASDTDQAKASGTTTGAPAPAPAISPTSGSIAATDASTQASDGADRNRAASFEGAGGGLPPYDPDAPQEIPATERADDAMTPGAGALLGVLALAGAAVLVARRKNG